MNSISIEELYNKIKRNENINLIDIRSVYQFNNGHIKNSMNIPKNLLMTNPSNYLSKNNTYYIYCQSGTTSNNVVNELNYLGYNTINVKGGYNLYLLMK